MILIENVEITGWEHAIRGMRNPLNSWGKSDSGFDRDPDYGCSGSCPCRDIENCSQCFIGPNDFDLMKCLRNAGTDHRKFMRMITVYVDITAPLYWWKEFDQYKVGTTTNSCSTMNKIHAKEFTLEDFSCDHLRGVGAFADSIGALNRTINILNFWRDRYNESDEARDQYFRFNGYPSVPSRKDCWYQMIQLLPSSYNQKRTVMMNYEVLANIYKSRRNHKLDEWAEHNKSTCTIDSQGECRNPKEYLLCEDCSDGKGFCDWIKTVPYSELITG